MTNRLEKNECLKCGIPIIFIDIGLEDIHEPIMKALRRVLCTQHAEEYAKDYWEKIRIRNEEKKGKGKPLGAPEGKRLKYSQLKSLDWK